MCVCEINYRKKPDSATIIYEEGWAVHRKHGILWLMTVGNKDYRELRLRILSDVLYGLDEKRYYLTVLLPPMLGMVIRIGCFVMFGESWTSTNPQQSVGSNDMFFLFDINQQNGDPRYCAV